MELAYTTDLRSVARKGLRVQLPPRAPQKFYSMDIVLKSLASAVVTAIILLIAKFSGAKVAGAIGGLPIVFAVTYVLLIISDKTLSRDFLVGGIYGAIAAIFFSAVLIWLNSAFVKNYLLNFAAAYLLCFALSLGLVFITSNKQLTK